VPNSWHLLYKEPSISLVIRITSTHLSEDLYFKAILKTAESVERIERIEIRTFSTCRLSKQQKPAMCHTKMENWHTADLEQALEFLYFF
jgi:hypothetical protein